MFLLFLRGKDREKILVLEKKFYGMKKKCIFAAQKR